jgi:hypothetical protein
MFITRVNRKQIELESILHEQEAKIQFYEKIVGELQHKQTALEEQINSLMCKRNERR